MNDEDEVTDDHELNDEGRVNDEHEMNDESGMNDENEVNHELPWKRGDWVKVEYDGELYPGEVISTFGDNTQVNAMAKIGRNWKWPEAGKSDILWYSQDKVKGKISPVLPVGGTRDHYTCNEL